MIYDSLSGALYSSDGIFLKTVMCPMARRIREVAALPEDAVERQCLFCKQSIKVGIQHPFDNSLAEPDLPNSCVFASPTAASIVMLQRIGRTWPNDRHLPVIRTARSLEAMVDGYRRGLRPNIRGTGGAREDGLGQFYRVWQHLLTHEVFYIMDRSLLRPDAGQQEASPHWHQVTEFQHAPGHPFPLAAYLCPPEMEIGDRFYLEDIIESIRDTPDGSVQMRKLSGGAIWDGSQFQHDEQGFPARIRDPDCTLVGCPPFDLTEIKAPRATEK